MQQLTEKFPDDLDARTLYAESLMDLRPWGYWTRDGQPYDETTKITAALEYVIGKNKNHPGALHLWIHLWESDGRRRAEAEADRLLPLMPGAGHMVHMPAHIYQRVGRHADVISVEPARRQSRRGLHRRVQGAGAVSAWLLPAQPALHLDGCDGERAEDAGARVGAQARGGDPARSARRRADPAGLPRRAVLRDGALRRVGRDPRRQGAVARDHVHAVGLEVRARDGVHCNGSPRRSGARAGELKTLIADPSLKGQTTFSANTGIAILRIAPEVIAGEIAAKRQDWDRAMLHLDRAVRYEDALVYQEPHDWHAPARQNLAAVLLAAGRADEAETVLWEDLKRNPEHVLDAALLSKALKARQGRRCGIDRCAPGEVGERSMRHGELCTTDVKWLRRPRCSTMCGCRTASRCTSPRKGRRPARR